MVARTPTSMGDILGEGVSSLLRNVGD